MKIYWPAVVGAALVASGAAFVSSQALLPAPLSAQEPVPPLQPREGEPPPPPREGEPPRGPGGPGFFPGGPGGPGGFGGPMGQDRQILKQFDKDNNKWLNKAERDAAREFIKKERASGGGGRGFGGRGGPGGPGGGPGGPGGPGGGPGGPGGPGGRGPGGPFGREALDPAKPGAKISPSDVSPVADDVPLYAGNVLRTLFLEFENTEWEAELADFQNTDVDVLATLIVDGKKYPNVGVRYRGMSSLFGVGQGYKKSLNLSLDLVDEKQRLQGYKTLNLLNSHEDSTMMHTVLYLEAARQHIPAPKANFVKLAINGESWGIYTNAQQFNKEFLAENFQTAEGARWKVQGSPGGRGGLEYLGDKLEEYKRRYTIKSKDNEKDWLALIDLCKTLNETPADKLEAALTGKLDIDGALWFLALENALINSDGYWVRASDYCIYRDPKGVFHMVPHDANETFQPGMGPGMGGPGGRGRGGFGGPGGPGGGGPGGPPPGAEGPPPGAPPGQGGPGAPGGGPGGPGGPGGRGPGGGGVELDPLVGLNDNTKPLRSKLLAVPSLKAKYLAHERQIASDWLDWQKLEPRVKGYRDLIEKEVAADTRKLTTLASFQQALGEKPAGDAPAGDRRPRLSLPEFAQQRYKFLMNHAEIKKLAEEQK